MTTLPERLLSLPELWRTRAARKRECGLVGEALLDDIHASELDSALEAAQSLQAQEVKCEARFNDDGTLDEVVGFGTFHLEQMDTGYWWMQLGPHMVGLHARGKITANFGANEAYAAPSPTAALQAGET